MAYGPVRIALASSSPLVLAGLRNGLQRRGDFEIVSARSSLDELVADALPLAQAQVGIGEISVQGLGAQEVFASAHSGARRAAILAAQCVKPRRGCFSHAGIELHFGGFPALRLRFCQRQGPGSQLKIAPVRFELGAAPGVAHSILEIGGSTPDPPPQCFRFQQISQRVIGQFLLHALRGFHCALEVEGIDFAEDGGCLRRQSDIGSVRGAGKRRQEEQASQASAASYRRCIHRPPSEKEIVQVQALRRTSLSCSSRVAS